MRVAFHRCTLSITAPMDGANPPAQTVVDLPYDAQTGRHRVTLADFPTAEFGPNAHLWQHAVGLYAKDAAGNMSTVNSLTLTVLSDEPTPTPTPLPTAVPWERF